ncbi:uncharacterized protein [Ptychodera flava]|uniref:uncharacterized protein isoform X2 n=1 Tax=Ptychodera flava TaxID=63121 RepID=UPI00396A5DB9
MALNRHLGSYNLGNYSLPTTLVSFSKQSRFENNKCVEPYCENVVQDSFMDFNLYMSTLYGWVPPSMKPKRHEPKTLETGNIIQLISRASGRYVRVHSKTGKVDGCGAPSDQAKFIVQKVGDVGDNLITLRSYVNPVNYLALKSGHLLPTGRGDSTCRFRFNVVAGEFMTFECVHNPCRFISVSETGSAKPMKRIHAKKSINGHFRIKITGQSHAIYAY